ncbi:MAG: hypothetical protein ACLGIV_04310 [Actinomycetes bacterium]
MKAPGARLVRFMDDAGEVVAETVAETVVRPWADTAGEPLWER